MGSFCVPVLIVSLSQRVIHFLVFLSTSCKMCENIFCTFFLKCFLNLIRNFSVQCQDDVSSPFFRKKNTQLNVLVKSLFIHYMPKNFVNTHIYP